MKASPRVPRQTKETPHKRTRVAHSARKTGARKSDHAVTPARTVIAQGNVNDSKPQAAIAANAATRIGPRFPARREIPAMINTRSIETGSSSTRTSYLDPDMHSPITHAKTVVNQATPQQYNDMENIGGGSNKARVTSSKKFSGVYRLLDWLYDKHAYQQPLVFQAPSPKKMVARLMRAVQESEAVNLEVFNVYVIANTFKRFISDLHYPIITCQEKIINAQKSSPDCFNALSDTIHSTLPSENMNVLREIIALLVCTAQNHKLSQMTPTSLAYIFGPSLLQLRMQTMTSLLEGPKLINAIILTLINHYETIFNITSTQDQDSIASSNTLSKSSSGAIGLKRGHNVSLSSSRQSSTIIPHTSISSCPTRERQSSKNENSSLSIQADAFNAVHYSNRRRVSRVSQGSAHYTPAAAAASTRWSRGVIRSFSCSSLDENDIPPPPPMQDNDDEQQHQYDNVTHQVDQREVHEINARERPKRDSEMLQKQYINQLQRNKTLQQSNRVIKANERYSKPKLEKDAQREKYREMKRLKREKEQRRRNKEILRDYSNVHSFPKTCEVKTRPQPSDGTNMIHHSNDVDQHSQNDRKPRHKTRESLHSNPINDDLHVHHHQHHRERQHSVQKDTFLSSSKPDLSTSNIVASNTESRVAQSTVESLHERIQVAEKRRSLQHTENVLSDHWTKAAARARASDIAHVTSMQQQTNEKKPATDSSSVRRVVYGNDWNAIECEAQQIDAQFVEDQRAEKHRRRQIQIKRRQQQKLLRENTAVIDSVKTNTNIQTSNNDFVSNTINECGDDNNTSGQKTPPSNIPRASKANTKANERIHFMKTRFEPVPLQHEPSLRKRKSQMKNKSLRVKSRAKDVSKLSSMFDQPKVHAEKISRDTNEFKRHQKLQRQVELEREHKKAAERQQHEQEKINQNNPRTLSSTHTDGKWHGSDNIRHHSPQPHTHNSPDVVSIVRNAFVEVVDGATVSTHSRHPSQASRISKESKYKDSWESNSGDNNSSDDFNDVSEMKYVSPLMSRANIQRLSTGRMNEFASRFRRVHSIDATDSQTVRRISYNNDADDEEDFKSLTLRQTPLSRSSSDIDEREDKDMNAERVIMNNVDDDIHTSNRPSELTSGFYRIQRRRRRDVVSDDDDEDDDERANALIPTSLRQHHLLGVNDILTEET